MRKQDKRQSFLHTESGTTLVEAMVAALIITVVMIGGLQFFYGGKRFMNQEKHRRIALSLAGQRMETALRYPYSQLADSLSELNTPISIGGLNGTRTTVVNSVDDPADSLGAEDLDGNTDDYKRVTVSVRWAEQETKTVTLETYISEYWIP